MKPLLLLFLSLLLQLPAARPPAVRVTSSPLTKAAYLAAAKAAVVTKPTLTFPVKKQKGRIVIPTSKGPKVFQDKGVGTDNDDQEQYEYMGYLPQFKCHFLMGHFWEHTQAVLVPASGEKQLVLYGQPAFSPDLKSFVSIASGIEYSVYPNEIRLFRFENGRWQQRWKLEPSVEPATWEPEEILWLSNSTLLLKKKVWSGKNPGSTFTYARLTIQ
jgi:hypothetical protein